MCIVIWKIKPDDNYKLILISNRDEDLSRKTYVSHYWNSYNIISSKDINFKGSQFAISLDGKFAVLTNLMNVECADYNNKLSRGLLVTNFVINNKEITNDEHIKYRPFNLLTCTITKNNINMYYSKWMKEHTNILDNTTYFLGNIGINEKSIKSIKGKELFDTAIVNYMSQDDLIEKLFQVLNNKDAQNPNDNIFKPTTDNNSWSTRTQNIILIDKNNYVTFIERSLKLDSLISIDENIKNPNILFNKKYICQNNKKWLEHIYNFYIE